MRFIPIIILSIFLSGCSISEYFRWKDPQNVNINPEVLEYCAPLNEDVKIEENGVLTVYSDMAQQYVTCAKKQAAGVKVIQELVK